MHGMHPVKLLILLLTSDHRLRIEHSNMPILHPAQLPIQLLQSDRRLPSERRVMPRMGLAQ